MRIESTRRNKSLGLYDSSGPNDSSSRFQLVALFVFSFFFLFIFLFFSVDKVEIAKMWRMEGKKYVATSTTRVERGRQLENVSV